MTKTRLTTVFMILIMLLSQITVFADNGLVEVEVGIFDKKVYFNDQIYKNVDLAKPIIIRKNVIYFPLAKNSFEALNLQMGVKESVTKISMQPKTAETTKTVKLEKRSSKLSKVTAKAQIKNIEVLVKEDQLKKAKNPILKYNGVYYIPFTTDVRNQLGLRYSIDRAGDMHIDSRSQKELQTSIDRANDAYFKKLVSFVKKVNKSVSTKDAEAYVNVILKETQAKHVDETWILAMIWQESGFDKNCQYRGAVGLMQMLVSTGKRMGMSKSDLLNPEKSIKSGVQYLANGIKKYKNVEKAVIAYNQGSYKVDKGTYKTWYLEEVKEKRGKLLKYLGN